MTGVRARGRDSPDKTNIVSWGKGRNELQMNPAFSFTHAEDDLMQTTHSQMNVYFFKCFKSPQRNLMHFIVISSESIPCYLNRCYSSQQGGAAHNELATNDSRTRLLRKLQCPSGLALRKHLSKLLITWNVQLAPWEIIKHEGWFYSNSILK